MHKKIGRRHNDWDGHFELDGTARVRRRTIVHRMTVDENSVFDATGNIQKVMGTWRAKYPTSAYTKNSGVS